MPGMPAGGAEEEELSLLAVAPESPEPQPTVKPQETTNKQLHRANHQRFFMEAPRTREEEIEQATRERRKSTAKIRSRSTRAMAEGKGATPFMALVN